MTEQVEHEHLAIKTALAAALDHLNAVVRPRLDDEEKMLYPFLIERPWKKYPSTLRAAT